MERGAVSAVCVYWGYIPKTTKLGKVKNEYILHNCIVLAIFFTNNCQSWLKFGKVITKTILTVFSDTRILLIQQLHNGLDARPLDDGGINDQLIKLHSLID